MKNYKKIYSFGCSFTEGGGLNSLEIRRILDNDPNRNYTPEEKRDIGFRDSFSGFLGRMLNCEVENHGKSKAGNELILNTMYETISKLSDTDNILVLVQPSILSRMLFQLTDKKKQLSVNGMHDIDGDVKTYYELYVTRFFDEEYQSKKLLQEIEVYTAWLNERNIDVLWLPVDLDMSKAPKTKHFVDFDGLSLGQFTSKNKLLICDMPEIKINDRHFSPKGNEKIAQKIYEHLKKYYD